MIRRPIASSKVRNLLINNDLVVLWGRPGIGKTSLCHEIGEELRRDDASVSAISVTWEESQRRMSDESLVNKAVNLVFIHDFEQAIATAQSRNTAIDRMSLLRTKLPKAKIVVTSRRKPMLERDAVLYG